MKRILLAILSAAVVLIVRPSGVWAQGTYQGAREEYIRAVETFRTAREDFLTAKEKLKDSRTAAQNKETLEKAKNFLLQADKTAIYYLRMVRIKIETVESVSENEKQAALTEIDSDILWLTNKQTEIEMANSREALVLLAQEVKNHWQKVRVDVKRISGEILAGKANFVLAKLTNVEKKVAEAIDRARINGRDVEQLETWLSDYKKKINLAEEKYQAAKEKFGAISNLAEANTLFNQGAAFIKEGNQYLREAQKNLKDIVRELNNK